MIGFPGINPLVTPWFRNILALMKKGASALALVLALSLVLTNFPAFSATPPKAGAECSKIGITRMVSGKQFKCVKSGRKLVWNSGKTIKPAKQSALPTATPAPTPSPASTPTPEPIKTPTPESNPKKETVLYSPPSEPSENIELCKIRQEGVHGTKSGFPTPTALYQGKGEVTWALIPIDFEDLPGEANFMTRAKNEIQFASEWADNSSEGQLKINWKIQDNWIRLPGSSKEYAVPKSDNKGFGSSNQQAIWTRVITETDKTFDFKGIQAVQFLLPAGQQIIEYGIKGNIGFDVVKNYVTNEGTQIALFSIPSTFNEEPKSGRNFWSWWMYHYMVGLGVGKFGGSNVATEMQTYLIQGTTEGARELGGWIRFLVGWMPEERVYCKSPSNISNLELTLIPLTDNATKGIKLAVFPLSKSKALILESRRVSKFSCTTPTERNGVLAYVYDSNLGHMDDYFTAISPSERPTESYSCFATPSRDLLLHKGDKISFGGIAVQVLAQGDFDQVRITRTP